MFVRVKMAAVLTAASVILSTPTFALQAPASTSTSSRANTDSMNERVCETITVTGSRLGKTRFCGTRAEWADKKLQDRQVVERIQASPCVLTHNSSTGRPAC